MKTKDASDTAPVENQKLTPLADQKSTKQMPPDEPLVHDISIKDNPSSMSDELPMKNVAIIFTVVIVLGALSGLGARMFTGGSKVGTTASGDKTLSNNEDVLESAGIADKETFSDNAEGTLENKTEDDPGEGSFKLVRPGGESQTVFLTSSTVDMSEFIGKKVRVYGETFSSEKVGWLMDVGFVEVIK